MKRTKSQAQRILESLQRGEKWTPKEAQKAFGTMRLAARVEELIKKGHNIQKKMVKVGSGKRVAEYWLENFIATPEDKIKDMKVYGKALSDEKANKAYQAGIDFGHLNEYGRSEL